MAAIWLAALAFAAGVHAETPKKAKARPPAPELEVQASKTLDRLAAFANAGMPVRFEYEDKTDFVTFNCKTGRVEDGNTSAGSIECKEKSSAGVVYAGNSLLDIATTPSELAFILGHELGHLAMRHGDKRVEKVMGLYDRWEKWRTEWMEKLKTSNPAKYAKLMDLLDKEGMWTWFEEDMTLAKKPDAQLAAFQKEYGEYREMLKQQERDADAFGCDLMVKAGYDAAAAFKAVLNFSDLALRGVQTEGPGSNYDPYLMRSTKLFEADFEHDCSLAR